MSKLKVIILNGSGGVGKDTFYKYCNNYISNTYNKDYVVITHISMVDVAKHIAKMTGWNGDKTERDRKYLSDIKDLIDNYGDTSMNNIKQYIASLSYQYGAYDRYVFIDSREPKDIKRLVDEYDAITVFIKNDNVDNIISNHADADVENYEYDYYIDNSGTLDDLEDNVVSFMSNVLYNEDIITIKEDELNEL